MTDDQLIGYCALHCTTERALFSADQINRMLDLAGLPRQRLSGWYSMHEDMAELSRLARAKQATKASADEGEERNG
jgi:hypothetical protein